MLVGFHFTNLWLLPAVVIVMFMIALLFTALGTMIASLMDDMQGFQLIINFLVMPLFFLSGALFPLTGLPKIIEFIVNIDPLSYGVDALRGIFISMNSSHFGIFPDFLVLGVVTLLLMGIGSYLFSKIQI